ncbi:thioredoxin-like domain-containing protein [Calothrix sp. PCC 6303]|uniref:thioredoxin-like domain-containing protein n=1 Tax=Calothrix sp. PCC 6303 TaxID=1170562 RepID=UPI0002A03749|nr:thioredoxin-like domain-containing protein [Calothrix sp. PCC 6303]AFY99858.1 NHL repeat containing protein [Calothrix sp. PCC 6303]
MTPRVRAPEFPKNYPWLNTDKPLSLQQLRGRVVILDFWTYCCINCLHVLPDLKYLEEKYANSLTVIGVHSAKFDNEKEIENIRQAILRYDIEHPVLVDSGLRVWQSYAVRAYPTMMVISPDGYVVDYFSGEGKREILDELINQLIQQYEQQGSINFQRIKLTLEKQSQPLLTPLAFPGKVLATSVGLFIADTAHHRIIWTKFDGEVLQIIGVGKAGFVDGDFEAATFSTPQGMTFDEGNQILYIADTGNHALRQVDLGNQLVRTIAGTGIQSRNIRPHCGKALETPLNSPWDLVKIKGNLWIAIAGSHQLWKMDLETHLIGTYTGTGAEACFDGELSESVFAQPSGITSDGENLYIADSEVSTIRSVGIGESAQVKSICGGEDLYLFGDKDGIGTEVRLQHCLGIEYIDNSLWIADTYNHKIKLVDSQSRNCQTILGDTQSGFIDAKGTDARFFEPSGLSYWDSYLYIADTNNHAIRKVNLSTLEVTTMELPGLCPPGICIPPPLIQNHRS